MLQKHIVRLSPRPWCLAAGVTMPALFKVFMGNHLPLSKHLTSLMSWKGWNIHVPGQIVFLKIHWLRVILGKRVNLEAVFGVTMCDGPRPQNMLGENQSRGGRGQLSGWKCKQEANHLQLPFPIYLSLISQFGKQISLLTAKITSCVITAHILLAKQIGQPLWNNSVTKTT